MGLLPHLDKASSALREVRLELSNGVTISGLWFQCRYAGLCGGHIGKPLLCKLVPFLPVMDMNGTLVDLAMINLLDITISVMGLEPRCSVLKLKDKYLELWSKNPELIQPLRQQQLELRQVATVRQIIAGAFAEMRTENIVVTDLNAGAAYGGEDNRGGEQLQVRQAAWRQQAQVQRLDI